METITPGTPTTHKIYWQLGLEQWEDGVRAPRTFQQWWLWCDNPDPFGDTTQTACLLDRTFFTPEGEATLILRTRHSVGDQRLRIIRADWPEGRLVLQLVFDDKSTIGVWIEMAYDITPLIVLKSFSASSTSRTVLSGKTTRFEYRIPECTEIKHVPVLLRGLKSR
jgi:hypothetical protein